MDNMYLDFFSNVFGKWSFKMPENTVMQDHIETDRYSGL